MTEKLPVVEIFEILLKMLDKLDVHKVFSLISEFSNCTQLLHTPSKYHSFLVLPFLHFQVKTD